MDFYISVCCVALVVLSSTASTAATNSEVKGSSSVVQIGLLPLIASLAVLMGLAFTLFGCCWYTRMRERSLQRVGQQYEVFAEVMANRMAQQQQDQQQQQQQGGAAEGEGAPGVISQPTAVGGAKMDKKQMSQAMMEAKHAKQAQKKYGYTRVSNTATEKPFPPSQANKEEEEEEGEDSDDGATENTPFPV